MQNISLYTDNSIKETVTKIPTKLNEIITMIINKMSEMLNAPTSEQIQNIDWSNISAILGTISLVLIGTILFVIALYLLRAIGLYTMAKKEGSDFAWLAFIPFGCFFTYGLITGKTKIFGIEIDHPWLLLPALMLSTFLPYVGPFATILFLLAYYAMLYKVYQTRTPNFAVVLLILSLLIPILPPIILFAIRNK